MSDDLQSFLDDFMNQSQPAASNSKADSDSDVEEVGSKKLQGPFDSLDLEDMTSIQPICTPITRMESTLKNQSNGRLVAVNENYICYVIKGNLIRCIHFVHVTRTKLEEHPAPLVDMEFAEHAVDLLASVDESGVVRVRRIYEEENACVYSTELEARLPVGQAKRVRWGPPDSGVIAVACDDNVVLLNYTDRAENDDVVEGQYPVFEPQSLKEAGSLCTADGAITDICFSPDYRYLLVTTSESCTIYFTGMDDTTQFAAPHSGLELVAELNTTSKALSSAMFVGSPNDCGVNSILVASTNNRVLQLWQPDSISDWTKQHELMVQADSEVTPWTNIGVDTTGHCIIIATVNCAFFNVIHLDQDNASFDLLTKWEIAHPILSFSTGFPALMNEDTTGESELNMFCIQTKAIQKYTIETKQCGHDPIAKPRRAAAQVAVPNKSSPPPLPVHVQAPPRAHQVSPPPVPVAASPTVVPTPIASSGDMESRLLASMSKMMDEKLQRERQLMSAELDAKLSKFADAMSKSINASVVNAVEGRTKKNFVELETKLKSTIQSITQSQLHGMKTALQNDSNRMKDEVVANVIKDIKQPIQASFKECFVQLLVPTLETSTQRMFDQIDVSLAEKFSAIPSPAQSAAIPTTTVAKKVMDPKEELTNLLNSELYEEALMKALGANDVDLVLWLCSQIDQNILHDTELSQVVCICLLQQLGRQLEVETKLKLGWLKEIALKLDEMDSDIASHVPKVVSEVKAKMKEFQSTDLGRAVRTELVVIQRVLP